MRVRTELAEEDAVALGVLPRIALEATELPLFILAVGLAGLFEVMSYSSIWLLKGDSRRL